MKRVLTLDSQSFASHCARLEALTERFNPDLVVGIATGGALVARQMHHGVQHLEVAARRPSTAGKGRWLKRLLRRLPRRVNDWLRIAESAWLQRRASGRPVPQVALTAEQALAISRASSILVVDDAVDSGITLAAVLAAVRASAQASATVSSAVITVTTGAPTVRPDVTLYDNSTLIRFPWSADTPQP